MLSYQTVSPNTLELLKQLSRLDFLIDTRLVGGTSLALQYGHRNSVDLDFFGNISTDNETIRENLRTVGNLSIIKETPRIKIYLLDGVKVDFVDYSYPWIDASINVDGLCLASPKDIAAMKINAIEGRGTRKDFIDIYFLLQHYTLQELLDFYVAKYPENSLFRAILSLSYFDDAELQPMPQMFTSVSWEWMKRYIEDQVKLYSSVGNG